MGLRPGERLGRFEIVELLGAGTMGEVYRARDPELDREVAIKVLPDDFAENPSRLRRFEREARSIGRLQHPNLLAIHDVGRHDGAPYLVCELLEGETMQNRLASGSLPPEEALDYGAQVAHGLAAAHAEGVVHRDLKPANLFVTRDGRVKILDFGLAKRMSLPGGDETEAPTMTALWERGAVLGTVAYMAPEQAAGRSVDHRADQFGLGVVLYEMLAGRRPFEGETASEALTALLRDDPEPLARAAPDVPAPVCWTVERCLARDPAARYDSTADLARELDTLGSRLTELAGPGTPTAAEPSGERPSTLAWATLTVLLMVVVAILAAQLSTGWMDGAPDPEYERITFRRGAVTAARFEPEGESVFYSASWEGNPSRIHLHRPGDLVPIVVGPPDSRLLSVSPAGELLLLADTAPIGPFARLGRLFRMPVTGAPRSLDDSVLDGALGPDGELAVVVREDEEQVVLEFLSTRGLVLDLRLSPGGDRVAFVETPGRGRDLGPIVVIERDGDTVRFDQQGRRGLAWSPSGEEIWFVDAVDPTSLRAVTLDGRERLVANFPSEVFLFDISPGGRVLLATEQRRFEMSGRPGPGEPERDLTWLGWSVPFDVSPDGETILFNECIDDRCRVALGSFGPDPPVLLEEGFGVALSPDGEWVASTPPYAPGALGLIATETGARRSLAVEGIDRIFVAAWAPDGQALLLNASLPGEGNRIFRLGLEGGKPVPLTPQGIEFDFFAVAPDGDSLAARRMAGGIAIYPFDGGEPTHLELDQGPIGWSADGRALYTASLGEVPGSLRRVEIASGRVETVAELMPADPSGVVQVSPVAVADDGGAYVYGYLRQFSHLFVVEGLQ